MPFLYLLFLTSTAVARLFVKFRRIYFYFIFQESNPALRLKEEVIAANTFSGLGFSSTGTGSQIQESGTGYRSPQDDFYNKKKISIDEDSIDGEDVDEVCFCLLPALFIFSSIL